MLFELCDQIADACLARFIAIQNDWFKVVLDATCNVCQMQPEDVARDVLLPDDDAKQDLILKSFHDRVKNEGIHKFVSEEFRNSTLYNHKSALLSLPLLHLTMSAKFLIIWLPKLLHTMVLRLR